jgi:hypothetical protein
MMINSMRLLCYGAIALSLAACNGTDTTDPGGHPIPPGLTLKLNTFVASGLAAPVFLTQPLDDGRIFVVEQPGRIRIVRDGVLQSTPYLDITSRVLYSGERGLLSVAFDPRYAINHYLYIYFTSQPKGDIRIERFTASNVDAADPASSKLLLTVPHSQQPNHNGGLLSFGPDAMLYAGLGDGGGAGDPFLNGQNPHALLASLLRVDVTQGDPYAIPTNNPYATGTNGAREVWAKGLRNPWRYAFDAPTGLLYIADVGQDLHEEIDVQPANVPGLNYGLNLMEGANCYNATTCSQTGLTLPVLTYDHTNGACSITGGYVYRGSAIPDIVGHYFYSDYCAGFLKSFRYSNGAAVDQKDCGLSMSSVTSFGKDAQGELYVIAGSTIFKIVQGS